MYEILLTQKLSATNNEFPELLDSDYDAKDLYEVEKMSLEDTKEKLDWRKRVFEYEKKNSYGIENRNDMIRKNDNEVNNIAKCNLIHDIINPPKRAKIFPLIAYSTWMYEYQKG